MQGIRVSTPSRLKETNEVAFLSIRRSETVAIVDPTLSRVQTPINIPEGCFGYSSTSMRSLDHKHIRIPCSKSHLVLVLFLERECCIGTKDEPSTALVPQLVAWGAAALVLDSLQSNGL